MPVLAVLETPDYLMLIGYFAVMLGIGAYFYRHMKAMKVYFTGGNKIPWWLSGVSFYMTSFSAFAFISYSDIAYKQGWVGVTVMWVMAPATLCSTALFAKRWRRARIDSPVEYIESRYGPWLRQIFVWQGVPLKIVDDAFKLLATGKIVSAGLGVGMSAGILWSGLIMLGYTFMGGLWAVTVTDFVQFVVLGAAVLLLLPLAVDKAGGFDQIYHGSPDGFFHLFSDKYTGLDLLVLVALYSVAFSSTNWSLIQKYYCVPREKDAVKVGWLVTALCLIGPPLMLFPSIAAPQFIPKLAEGQDIYPTICLNLLPAGLLGLVIAAMFSATMSTLSGDYNVAASVLTNDVYRRLVNPKAGQRQLVFVGRAMTLVIGLINLAVALLMVQASGERLFEYMVTLFGIGASPIGLPMMAGMVSKRITNRGAMTGMLVGITVGLSLFAWFQLSDRQSVPLFGWQCKSGEALFLATTLSTFVTMTAVSLLVPASAEERARIEAFRRRMDAPIGTLPEDRHVDVPGLGGPSPFRVVGICTVLIGLTMLAMQPWVGEGLASRLNLIMALGLTLFGAIMAWLSRGRTAEER